MRIAIFIIAALLHTVAFAHPAADMANQYAKYLNQLRLFEVSPDSNADARKIADAFAKVKAASGVDFPVTLIITDRQADVFAQSFPGETIVINTMLVSFNEDVMMFMLAHELGHVRKRDLDQAVAFYAEQISSEASVHEQEVAFVKLQPRMTAISHGFEFDADDFAAKLMLKMGYTLKQPIKFLSGLPHGDADNTSHPASATRAQKLKALQ
jgi:Zn-dependent protease with chaperone function